jgi:hypothetical protein
VLSTFSTGAEPLFPTDWGYDPAGDEAYEAQFGMSRGILALIARVRVLVARRGRVDLPAATEALEAQARALLQELRQHALEAACTPQRGRVALGDAAYRYALQITLLTEVLGAPGADERVQAAVRAVLELCAETLEPVMLQWPLIIAGSRAVGDDRKWVSDLYAVFRQIHCSDCVAAERLMSAQWARIDGGRGWAPWHVLMREIGLDVLLI